MTVVDLSRPLRLPPPMLQALPRRVSLTLPELQQVAAGAGGAPLPFDLSRPHEREWEGSAAAEDAAYARVLASLHEPRTSLVRRGLMSPDGVLDPGLAGAVGLLAKPEVVLDLEVAVDEVHARAWHRQAGAAVATLGTVDGVVFEVAWFPAAQWAIELARVAALPPGTSSDRSAAPPQLVVPHELLDAATEAVRSGRPDLVAPLVEQHPVPGQDPSGRPWSAAAVTALLAALPGEARGRLRALVAPVGPAPTRAVGVASWVLLRDGWHAVRPWAGREGWAELRRVEPADLAVELAAVLAVAQDTP